jgi:hypothetical protein
MVRSPATAGDASLVRTRPLTSHKKFAHFGTKSSRLKRLAHPFACAGSRQTAFLRRIVVTIFRTDDQVVLAEKSNQVWQLFIGFASHPQPVLPEEFLRVIEFPVACVPTRCSSRAESPLAEVIKSGQHQLDEYHLTRNAGVRLY